MKNSTVVNDQIRAHLIVLIDKDGENKGQYTKDAAIKLARSQGLDLVQVSSSNPPVCKIVDYGKMMFEKKKNEKKNEHHSKEMKEVWFHIKTQQHDIDIKLRKALEWIKKGHRTRFVVKLEGREKRSENHRTMAKQLLTSIVDLHKTVLTAGNISEAEKELSVTCSPV